ncbi:MAG: hypothetical protein LBS99_05935, partial [Clostridiales bacterium]|nr:hypothetical protein [Clostridiales bacterium]
MKKRARWLGMCALALLLCVQPLMFGACAARGSGSGDLSAAAVTDPPSETEVTPDKYIFYALSDPNKAQLTAQVKALKAVVGNTYESDKYKLAFATDGPRPLDQTVAQMEQEIDEAFEVAIAYDMPVYIKIDDLGYLKDKGNDTAFASDEDLHDTYNFAGDEATLYFNWGTWRYTDYVPAIGTPAYRAFIADKIVD